MSEILLTAIVVAAIGFLWSMPPIRIYAVGWMPDKLGDVLEGWAGAALFVLVLGLTVVTARALHGGVVIRPPSPTPCMGIGDDRPSMPTAEPIPGRTLAGRVVMHAASGKLRPIVDGKVRVGQIVADVNPQGTFEVALPDSPQPDTLVQIEAAHSQSRFLRLDDTTLKQHQPIEIVPKRRILVLPANVHDSDSADEEIRRALENELGSEQLELLSNDKLRDEVLNRLYAYQQNSALYDPETIARAGNFHGATDGVFWLLAKAPNSFTLDCKLVNFTTAKVEQAVDARFSKDTPLVDAAVAVADLLMARIAQAKILSPRDTAEVIQRISLRGFSANIPKNWTLWIGVLPEGNDRFFPQRRLSAHGDQSFYAPDVYVGPEGALQQPTRFELYSFLTAPNYSEVIQQYIQTGTHGGLDMNAWNKDLFKILDHIVVVRRK